MTEVIVVVLQCEVLQEKSHGGKYITGDEVRLAQLTGPSKAFRLNKARSSERSTNILSRAKLLLRTSFRGQRAVRDIGRKMAEIRPLAKIIHDELEAEHVADH